MIFSFHSLLPTCCNYRSFTRAVAAFASLALLFLLPISDVLSQQFVFPLETYWSPIRIEHFTTASDEGRSAAAGANYDYLRTEGYVQASEQAALKAGYQFVRIEGYVLER